ncbi:MAG: fibronectin type III domain-containing protein [Oscillospiraceae bacterium]|nr:fibronectin type III domain-containing protein [Oscillospiraceae bacterium]
MSDPNIISPLLDGFTMGNPISEHDGVRCCPAIKENTDKKYIVKIISIPASQVQMDALLLAGAYKDPADAMEYFRQTGEGILKEAELLKTLSRLDGFLPYEGWQMEPITRHRLGYEVYLVGSYKRSLEKYLKKHPVTHLEAINLSLDLCAALSVCRQAGALYVALKPANVFVSEKKDYRIGDLGFVQLDDLRFLALPGKYHSAYTPPELLDPMASINLTVDTYAVGMILYQLYNDGQLPFKGLRNAEDVLPSPVNADYELAEIIMKAIHPDPDQRWSDPADLGKALASYMQRNSVNDVPITPHTPLDVKPEDIVVLPKKKKKRSKQEPDAAAAQNTAAVPEMQEQPEEAAEPVENSTEIPDDTPVVSETALPEEAPAEEDTEEAAEAVPPEIPEELPEESPLESASEEEITPEDEEPSAEPEIPEESPESPEESVPEPEEPEAVSEEDVPEEPTPDTEEDLKLSEELSRIIAKADDLISHEIPEEAILPPPEEAADPFAFVREDSDEIDDSDIPLDPVMEDEEEPAPKSKKKKKEQKFADPKYKKRRKRLFGTIAFLLALCIAAAAGFWYYQNMYLRTIHAITIDGSRDALLVQVDTDAEENLITVICSDNYGNTLSHPLTAGQAVFKDLLPNTMYKIQLEIDGFHGLVGKTSDIYTTDATTKIASFTYVAGAEDGSVMLNFTVDGEEPDSWTLFYSAEGEDELRKTFTGHSITVNGLTVGKLYTFTLDTSDNLSLDGQTTLELMASRLILAEELHVSTSGSSDITVSWSVPGDVVVDSWEVRCYNNAHYDEKVYVSDTQATFFNIDPAFDYTVEVTAAGMTQPARASITKNPIAINQISFHDSSAEKLTVDWEFSGEKPKDGWLLMYTIDGGEKNVVKCDQASAVITPKIPGAKYDISIHASNGTSIFNNTDVFTVPQAAPFDKNNLKAEQLRVDLVKTPAEEEWTFEDLEEGAIADTFAPGESISIVMRCEDAFYLPGASVKILYVIRDTYGNVLPDYVSEESISWKKIWTRGEATNGELTIPKLPNTSGAYTLDLIFDGMSVASLSFTIAP